MEQHEAEWSTAYDGKDFTIELGDQKLIGQSVENVEGSPRFIYIFVHGLGVCINFKRDFYPIINQFGGVAFACDHIGHGRSPGARVSCQIPEVMEETKKVIEYAKGKYPGLPVVLHGHSMGGLTVVNLAMREPEFVKTNVNVQIIECPWISPCPQREASGFLKGCVKMLSYTCKNIQLDSGVKTICDAEHQTWRDLHMADEYRYGFMTPRLFTSVNEHMDYANANYDKFPSEVPTFFIQGMKDILVNPTMNETWMRKVLDAKSDHKHKMKTYPEGSHVVLKCPCRGECIRDIFDFISTNLSFTS